MIGILDWSVDYLGMVIGVVFIFLQIRAVQTLIGSAFKRHHLWMGIGSLFFTLAFLTDLIAVTHGNNIPLDIEHHIVLFISAIIFISTNLSLPQEASQYLDLKSKEKAK